MRDLADRDPSWKAPPEDTNLARTRCCSAASFCSAPPTPADQPAALVEGFQVAFTGASVLPAIAAIVLAATLRASDTANINPRRCRSSPSR